MPKERVKDGIVTATASNPILADKGYCQEKARFAPSHDQAVRRELARLNGQRYSAPVVSG
ncbi:MAG: hypothetical protein WAO98_07450 [Alphaproteobacteria bacterium]